MTDVRELFRRANQQFGEKVATIRDEQWNHPTPCAEWNVRDLVNHLVSENEWIPPLMEGKTIAEVGDQFDGDVLGDDPAARSSAATTEATEATAKHLPEGGMVNVSWGQIPAEEYVWQLTSDHLIHAWDLAAATGQSRDLDPELVAAVAQWFAPNEEMVRAAGVIKDRQDLNGDPQTDLLAGYGRRADWSA